MDTSKVLSGKDTAVAVYASFKKRLDILSKKGIIPGLCVILVGDDPASQIYVKTKSKKLQSIGLRSKKAIKFMFVLTKKGYSIIKF